MTSLTLMNLEIITITQKHMPHISGSFYSLWCCWSFQSHVICCHSLLGSRFLRCHYLIKRWRLCSQPPCNLKQSLCCITPILLFHICHLFPLPRTHSMATHASHSIYKPIDKLNLKTNTSPLSLRFRVHTLKLSEILTGQIRWKTNIIHLFSNRTWVLVPQPYNANVVNCI